MTELEKQEIIAEVEASVMAKVDKKYGREDTQSVLKAPREKWFGNSNTRYKGLPPMREAFGAFIDYQVWEIIRRLTCLIMGRKYVRQLSDSAKAENAGRMSRKGVTPNPGIRNIKNMESVLERMARENTAEKVATFMQKEKQPYEFKRKYAQIRVEEFVRECENRGLNYHVSVGGLDSIVLYLFINEICGIETPGVSASTLEDRSIQTVHRALGITNIPPLRRSDGKPWTKANVISEFGFPVLSKEIAAKIELLQNPTEKNKTVRHAIITGETGEYGGWQKNSRMKLPQRWLEKFGGYENENEGCNYQIPDFKVSSKCCYYLKERNCDNWAKENHSVPFLGLMASEGGGRRAKALRMHGCNYFGRSTIRSAPFAIFNRQDVLRLALEIDQLWKNGLKDKYHKRLLEEGKLSESFKMPDSIIPEIYGTIERNPDGTLYTTKAQRTGCSMCGFGIHMEKRPHRFDQLYERNRKEWEYLMFHLCKDPDGNDYGWARVLDYIGVGWRPEDLEKSGQMEMSDFIDY